MFFAGLAPHGYTKTAIATSTFSIAALACASSYLGSSSVTLGMAVVAAVSVMAPLTANLPAIMPTDGGFGCWACRPQALLAFEKMLGYYSPKMPRAISKFQRFLGWLLCACVLSAALDNIPDPPVIKPHGDKAASVYLASPHQPPVADRSLDRILIHPASPMRRFDRSSRFEGKPLLPVAPLLSQASDSSPPLFVL